MSDRSKRFYNSNRSPKARDGKPIWDPRDPFIIAYQLAHPRVEAAWRTGRKPIIAPLVNLDIETSDAPVA